MEREALSAGMIDIFLFGPVCVQDHTGQDVTPSNQKSRAIVAMLALAPRGSRSRVWLRDKLWSDRNEEQASASLRQALTSIRKALGPDLRDILLADKYSVTLDLTRARIDVVDLLDQRESGAIAGDTPMDDVPEHLLEGLDIGDPEFESWLTLERQIWEARLTSPSEAKTPPISKPQSTLPPRSQPPTPTLAQPPLLASAPVSPGWAIGVQLTGTPGAAMMAEQLAEKLMRNLNEMGRINVLRLPNGEAPILHDVKAPVPLIVRLRELNAGADTRLVCELLAADTGVTHWSTALSFTAGQAVDSHFIEANGVVSETAIQIGRYLKAFGSNQAMVDAGELIECIYQIFGLGRNDLDSAESTLARLLKNNPTAQLYAWMAFAKSFRVGQRFSPDAANQISEAQYYATRALEEDQFDPLVLSLSAHIHSYLFSEYDIAASLFERALKANPDQVIGWDLYAMLNAYVGDQQKSLKMASWAQHLGSHTPLSYYFDTTKCISAALAGEYEQSIRAGERALIQRPQFNSILRYLIACNAHLGNAEAVETLRARLLKLEPDFDTDVLRSMGYPGLSTDGGRNFLLGLEKAGLGSKK